MRYGHPDSLWLLALAGALLLMMLLHIGWRRRRLARVGDPRLVERLTRSTSVTRQVVRALLLAATMALLALSLARPQLGGTTIKTRQEGIDIVFVLDISKSMLARDLPPSRLQSARLLLDGLLQKMGSNRVALVPFSGLAFTQCPLTRDYSAIRVYLQDLQPGAIPVGGTAIGRALTRALTLLGHGEDDKPKAEVLQAAERIIILITDGEDHESEPLQAAKAAAEAGIRVYTVGMGSITGEPIPIVHSDGSLQGYQKDRKGQFVYTRLDEDTLRSIAEETRGLYVPYDSSGQATEILAQAIADLEKTELERALRRHYDERFQYALFPALLFLLLEMLLGDRVGSRWFRRGSP